MAMIRGNIGFSEMRKNAEPIIASTKANESTVLGFWVTKGLVRNVITPNIAANSQMRGVGILGLDVANPTRPKKTALRK
jgi:hypothetical protein